MPQLDYGFTSALMRGDSKMDMPMCDLERQHFLDNDDNRIPEDEMGENDGGYMQNRNPLLIDNHHTNLFETDYPFGGTLGMHRSISDVGVYNNGSYPHIEDQAFGGD